MRAVAAIVAAGALAGGCSTSEHVQQPTRPLSPVRAPSQPNHGTGSIESRYSVSLRRPQSQNVDIELRTETGGQAEMDLALPVWRPGRYEVLEPAGTVSGVRATDGAGRPLPFRKIDKSTWRVSTAGASELRFSYTVYANSLASRTRHVDDTHAFLSPSCVFVHPVDRLGAPVRVRMDLPDGWRVATGLESSDGGRTMVAPNYDVLVDSPIEAGVHESFSFEVAGKPHEVAVWSAGIPLEIDRERIIRDFSAIIGAQERMWGSLPYERYVFLIHAAEAGGGTEHVNSTIMQTSRESFEDDGAYRRFLSLVSHEYFHTWNVKQLRPADLKPYDYAHENYTSLLWVVEGTTSYYDDLFLCRAGLNPPDDYLRTLQGAIGSQARRPGRTQQSLEDSSFDAWIKFNRKQPDELNTTVDFYSKGALVSALLDLEIRRRSGGAADLDRVLRALWERFPLGGPGYTSRDVVDEVERAVGGDMRPFFDAYVSGTNELRWDNALEPVGLRLVFDTPEGEPAEKPTLGLELSGNTVRSVRADGPAYAAPDGGIIVGDEIIAINDRRATSGDLGEIEESLKAGEEATVLLFRRDRLRTVRLVPSMRPNGSWKIERVENPSEAQRAAFKAWLWRDWDE